MKRSDFGQVAESSIGEVAAFESCANISRQGQLDGTISPESSPFSHADQDPKHLSRLNRYKFLQVPGGRHRDNQRAAPIIN